MKMEMFIYYKYIQEQRRNLSNFLESLTLLSTLTPLTDGCGEMTRLILGSGGRKGKWRDGLREEARLKLVGGLTHVPLEVVLAMSRVEIS